MTEPACEAVETGGRETAPSAAPASIGPRMRIRFAKQGDLRLISHRDLVRALERLFRRTGIEVQLSQGFHPKPRMMFPSALSLGVAGQNEVLEVDLAVAIEASELLARLSAAAPDGLQFRSAELVPPGKRKAALRSLEYEVELPAECVAEAEAQAARLMELKSCLVVRPGREQPVDLRATLAELTVSQGVLRMTLLATREAQARPRDILEQMGLADLETQGFLVRTRVELD